MRRRTCQEAYQHGVNSRLAYPLHSGLYKLVESKGRIEQLGMEIFRISEVVNNCRHPAELMHCTFQDKAYWLRDVPCHIAYRFGYEIIPGLRALEADGVGLMQAESTAMFLESVIKQHLALWDGLRNSYSKKIENEYELMRNGHSNALSIVDDALNLVNLAVGRLPANIQARI